MSLTSPPRPDLAERVVLEPEALIEEARRRARRRRQRNLVGLLAALLGTLWLYSLLGAAGSNGGSALRSESSPRPTPRAALPEELSYNADGGVVLVHRDGTRDVLARATYRHPANGTWFARLYSAIEWARDGSRLLVLRWGSPRALVVADAKGRVGRTIARADDGRWSPDGTRIAFARRVPGRGRVLALAASSGRSAVRVATRVSAFSWSVDGTKLAYSRAQTTGVSIADTTGTHVRRRSVIAKDAGAPRPDGADLRWSPDGSRIAFTADGGVFVVRPDGRSLRRVLTRGNQVAWAPDGSELAVAAGLDVYVVRADGSDPRLIAHCPCTYRGATGTSVAWSPDGGRIAFISGRGNDVSTIRPDGTDAVVVAPRATDGSSGLQVDRPLWRPRP